MNMFTAVRAVGLAGLIVTLSGFRLVAQDVLVSDLAWMDSEKAVADTLPVFKKKPFPEYPQDLKKAQSGYVIVIVTVHDDDRISLLGRWASHPYFKEAKDWNDGAKFQAAKKDGKPVGTVSWYSIIFNPKEASAKGAESVPRLLAAAPVIVPKERLSKVPGVDDNHLTVWTTVKVAADGTAQVIAFDNAAQEIFRDAIEGTLPAWRFAPARHEGKAVEAETSVAFFVARVPKIASVPMKPDQFPKVIKQARPEYPLSLRRSRQQGEVVVAFTVDEKGDVKDAKVVRSNHPDFEDPALEAIYKWKYAPAMAKGKPVPMKCQVPIQFNLNANARDGAMQVETASAKQKEKMPEALRYDVGPKPSGVLYPVFPFELLIEKTGGKAEVAFIVGEDGRVSDVKVLKADRPEFGEALSAAVAAFEFMPAVKDGKPMGSILRMEHEFSAGGWSDRPSTEDLSMAALVRKHPERIVTPAKLDVPLKPISQRAPVFPATAKADNGEALIEVLVDKDGRARLPRIISASEPALGYAAAQAAGDWRFEEPKAGGKSVIVRARVPFRFGKSPKAEQSTASTAAPSS